MDGLLRSGPFEVNFAVSANGTLAYSAGATWRPPVHGGWTRGGAASPVDSTWIPDGNITTVALAPDGRSMAVSLGEGRAQDIWVKQLPSGPFSRITFGDTVHTRAASTEDSRSVPVHQRPGCRCRRADDPPCRRDRAPRAMLHASMMFAQVVQTADAKWLVLLRSFARARAPATSTRVRTGDSTLVPLLTSPRGK